MWYFAIALALGVLVGALLPLAIPLAWARYLAVVLLAAIDAAFGGIRASLEDRFDFLVFASGFFVNGVVGAGLTFIGDLLGVNLYDAALFAFGYRIFQNLGVIRRHLIDQWRARRGAGNGDPSVRQGNTSI